MFLTAVNLILDLKCFDVRPMLLSGLVTLLRPTKEEVQQQQNMEGSVLNFKSVVRFFFCFLFSQRLNKYSKATPSD